MRASEIQDLLIRTLARELGGTQRQWRLAIGPVRVHDRATHPHCNWSVAPSGSIREIEAIEQLLDEVRLRYPLAAID
jgi:hypothetical protein